MNVDDDLSRSFGCLWLVLDVSASGTPPPSKIGGEFRGKKRQKGAPKLVFV
jgi:hypothetical protein